MYHEPEDSPTKVKVIFHAYSHSETAELELPADFWQLDPSDREALLAEEYNLWLNGARRPWEVLTENPADELAEDDEPEDDNQDGTDYPEHPADEQHD